MKKAIIVLCKTIFVLFVIVSILTVTLKINSSFQENHAQQELPQEIVSDATRESIRIEDYVQIPSSYGELGFDAPTQKLSPHSSYWILGDNPNLLFKLQYEFLEGRVVASVLMNQEVVFPILSEAEISAVCFNPWEDGFSTGDIYGRLAQMQYNPQTEKYENVKDLRVTPAFTAEERNQLRSLAFTSQETIYRLYFDEESNPLSWSRNSFVQTWETDAYQTIDNIDFESDSNGSPIVYDICWYFTDIPAMYYRQYYLVRDTEGIYYISDWCSQKKGKVEVGNRLAELPTKISEKIEAAFLEYGGFEAPKTGGVSVS